MCEPPNKTLLIITDTGVKKAFIHTGRLNGDNLINRDEKHLPSFHNSNPAIHSYIEDYHQL